VSRLVQTCAFIHVFLAATSSYTILPPPYTHIYSAGGPTGEIHAIDPSTGGFGEKIQQFLFVPEDELEKADKTRVALVCLYDATSALVSLSSSSSSALWLTRGRILHTSLPCLHPCSRNRLY